MIFSATFMAAGIIQLPLQLFWNMKQLSVALVRARISQIIALVAIVYRAYPHMIFDGSPTSKIAFLAIMATVMISAITQFVYVLRQAHKILPIKIQFSRSFIRDEIRSNRQYGLAYCLSSFHTLAVLILLSNYFPTAQGYTYTGIRALALALIEIFLIIPSALGNSLLHKIANYSSEDKRRSFGNFLQIIRWIGCVIGLNLFIRSSDIISIIAGPSFIGESRTNPGANHILPFLGIVLALSFIKQVYNYLFVAEEKQNLLFWINLVGVIIGLAIGLWTIPHYGILGGIVTQLTLEITFVIGSIYTAHRQNITPIFPRQAITIITITTATLARLGYQYIYPEAHTIREVILYAGVINIAILGASYQYLRRTAR
jgi:O-antigen/teichoic acid export membrane protein